MSYRIEIGFKRGIPDARGRNTAAAARELGLPVRRCRTREVYKIDIRMNRREQAAVRRAFVNEASERAAAGRLPPPAFDWMIEITFKPGVTDNLGRTARGLAADALDRKPGDDERIYTGRQYFLVAPGLNRESARRLAREVLANELIHEISVFSPREWAEQPPDRSIPRAGGDSRIEVRTYNLEVDDDALLRISREGVLSLNIQEMHAIRDHYRREDVRRRRSRMGLPPEPTDIELECIAQSWSEHCSHKIFAARIDYTDENGRRERIDSLFKTCIRGATERIAESIDWLKSVFTDNAGIIAFNERLNLVYKAETHNSPTALDPYGGAITGIVGVNRDPMGTGMGAEMLCNTWGYCLASPFYDGELPEGLFPPRRVRDGVHQGVIDGGNQSGIPYARGFEIFDERYLGKPLVYCGTLGTLPAQVNGRPSERKEVMPGDAIVMAGGRIGKDGIHGATFSSEELRKDSPAQAVQIGDPITQRKLYEFLLEARDRGLYRALTDNGAGGLSSSVGEMATIPGGADLDLAKAPLKYQGLQPWEIFLSEAQERMTLAAPPDRMPELLDLARRRDVEATALGTFTDSGELVLRHGDGIVGRLELGFLHGGCPVMSLEARWTPPAVPAPRRPRAGGRTRYLLNLLGSLNLCSNACKARQYDHEVKGRSIIKPLIGRHGDIPSDAAVLLAEYDRREGVVLSEGINPFYSDLDTYAMAASVIDIAVRRIIAAGGRLDFIAGLDNFCWPDPVLSDKTPDGPYKLAQLVRANRALYDLTVAYGVPCISGKDSMKNDSVRGGRKISIPPTLLFSAVGKIDDIGRAVTSPFKQAGDAVWLLGDTHDETGASAFVRLLAAEQGRPGAIGGTPPGVDAQAALRLYRRMQRATRGEMLRSATTPVMGGLAIALARCVLGSDLGAEIDLAAVPGDDGLDDDTLLFSESNSRFLVSVAPQREAELEELMHGLPAARIGTVTAEPLLLARGGNGAVRIKTDASRMRRVFTRTLEGC